MNKVRQMLESLEKELRKEKNYSAADKLLPIIEEAKKDGWIPVAERLPDDDEDVLVLANGKPHPNITLVDAYELAAYSRDDDGGWILEMWPEWMEAVVTHWMPLPEPFSSTSD